VCVCVCACVCVCVCVCVRSRVRVMGKWTTAQRGSVGASDEAA
jgi:hypothetical protein